MTRGLAATALALGLAGAAPAASACDLDHCPGTAVVCGVVDCTPSPVVGCAQPLGLVHVCV